MWSIRATVVGKLKYPKNKLLDDMNVWVRDGEYWGLGPFATTRLYSGTDYFDFKNHAKKVP